MDEPSEASWRGVEGEVIVVDDRSSDRTPRILAALAAETDRLRVRRVDAVPDGWIAKCHALHLGGRAAVGDWILFTDADVWMAPDVVARAIAAAVETGADHVTLFPAQRTPSIGGRAANLVFLSALIGNAARANRDGRRAFVGIGAFNLVRADAWRGIGGHEPLRLKICDDMKLGLLLRRAGRRTRALFAGWDVEVVWAPTVRALVFAILRFNPLWTLLAVAAEIGLASLVIPARLVTARAGWGWGPALLVPAMHPVMAVALIRLAWISLRRGGVRWRDTFYPLETLKRGLVR